MYEHDRETDLVDHVAEAFDRRAAAVFLEDDDAARRQEFSNRREEPPVNVPVLVAGAQRPRLIEIVDEVRRIADDEVPLL